MINKKTLFILSGPTGIGKSKIGIELAKILNTEIISADSMQIYKYMDIGTAKVTGEEQSIIKHHMIDIIYPDEDFSVDEYKNFANEIILDLNNKAKIPIIVGGTGLYIDSLIYDLDFNIAAPNPHLRNYYENIAENYGNKFLHDILKKVDPVTAEKNHPNQVKRIIRALEVFDQTSKPFSFFNKYKRKYLDNIDFKYIVLNRDRQELYEIINNRVDKMLSLGLVDEVKKLIEKGYSKDLNSMQAIGYKECLDYLDRNISYQEMVDLLKQNTRKYAKRQLTWFRKEESKIIININKDDDCYKIVQECLKIFKGD